MPPDPPSALTVLGSNRTSASIKWDPPEADGGSAVLSYEVSFRPKSRAAMASMPNWMTVSQVRPDVKPCHKTPQQADDCRLKTASYPEGIRFHIEKPLQPMQGCLDCGHGNGACCLHTADAKTEHAVSAVYEICWALQGTATACTLSCLHAGCIYQVRIRAQNASGWGQHSLPKEVRAAPGVPHAPGPPRAVGQSAVAIEVVWGAPQHDGGSIVTSYRLEMSAGELHCRHKLHC